MRSVSKLPTITLHECAGVTIVRYNGVSVAVVKANLSEVDLESVAVWAISVFDGLTDSEIQLECEYNVTELNYEGVAV